jgi:hypothetical protein
VSLPTACRTFDPQHVEHPDQAADGAVKGQRFCPFVTVRGEAGEIEEAPTR